MRRPFISAVMVCAASLVLITGCSTAAPAPATATKAAAGPQATSQSAPATTPPPTAAPAKKVEFPSKGKPVTMLIPFAAGGSTDVGGRLVAGLMEKELGVPVEVVNKPGAGTQVGLTELSLAKPDGYTIGFTNLPTSITVYLDPDRKPAFSRKDLQPVAQHLVDPLAIAVKADSPYKTTKDLIDAAKAKPEGVRAAVSGILSILHLGALMLEQDAGVKFANVHFDGGAPGLTALLGGHVDVSINTVAELQSHAKNGTVRVLGVMDKQESKFLPGVTTLESQGFKVVMVSSHTTSVPAATPKEVVQVLSESVKNALETQEIKTKMTEMGLEPRYLGPDEAAAVWNEMESQVKPLMEFAKR